ncbi:amino acid-binding ACT protein [Gordonia sp. TBRC 11910]|uniref:Amino acid-binding ACT protein n=1 Tax=Gordonia asplenii TaxID=2725283 RepID=A0A848KMK2_9ACTN|nr:ACT domain-containing protein [Gordonia asplenii]NMO00314.1 amino acid-binding ACT protein [Gordonia asplenii]
MRNLVLSVIGDDRAGLVSALADAIATNGGSWDRSQLARLAGKFAGIVVVTVPGGDAERLIAAVTALDGLLEVEVHDGDAAPSPAWTSLHIELLGNDRPGIVQEISTALSTSGASIEHMTTGTREAPMAGGLLFEAQFDVRVPPGTELAAVRADLELLAAELLVDLDIDAA